MHHPTTAWTSTTPLALFRRVSPITPTNALSFSSTFTALRRHRARAPIHPHQHSPRTAPKATANPPDPRGLNGQQPFYLALVAAQSIPFLIPHPGIPGDLTYFTVTALACIIIGCRRAPLEQILSKPISTSQAFAAPFAASTFLFGSYLLLKYTQVNVGLLLNGLTTFAGSLCLKEALDPVFHSALTLANLQDRKLFRLPFSETSHTDNQPEANSESEAQVQPQPEPFVTIANLCSTLTALTTTALYLTHQYPTYVYSNLISVAICTRVLSLVRPASFLVATGLLTGLFLYDIFWVFGSEVMVSVATQIDSPGKLLFPRDNVTQGAYPYAILGLGDICVPGLFASLAQSMDQRLAPEGEAPYFSAAMVGYTVGLMATFAVNLKTSAAQPALLYLVPALILSIVGTAAVRGQLREVIGFQVEHEEGKTA